MKAGAYGQNFLRNRRTANRLVHLAGGPDDALCVDLGAGRGIITQACRMRSGPIMAVEKDSRLVAQLRHDFAGDLQVSVVEGDLLSVPLPTVPFIIVANPPFNESTNLVRRWMTPPDFISGALIVERAFAQRIAGDFGATKLSLSLAPFLLCEVSRPVRAAEFSPQPNVSVSLLTAVRRVDPLVLGPQRDAYWLFVNYLFERSQPTVGKALKPLRGGIDCCRELSSTKIRDLTVGQTVDMFGRLLDTQPETLDRLRTFDESLTQQRKAVLAGDSGGVRKSPDCH